MENKDYTRSLIQMILDFIDEYSKDFSGPAIINPSYNAFVTKPTSSCYEIDLGSAHLKNIQNMESIGLNSLRFSINDSINMIAAVRHMIIYKKMEFYRELRRMYNSKQITQEDFLSVVCSIQVLVRDKKYPNKEIFRVATQYLQIKEYDEAGNVRCKNVETLIDGMTEVSKAQAYDPLFISENLGLVIHTNGNQELTQLSNRIKNKTLNRYLQKYPPTIFRNRASDVVDCYTKFKRVGITPTNQQLRSEMGLKSIKGVTSHFEHIKYTANQLISLMFPECNTECWGKRQNEVRPYLDVLFNVGMI